MGNGKYTGTASRVLGFGGLASVAIGCGGNVEPSPSESTVSGQADRIPETVRQTVPSLTLVERESDSADNSLRSDEATVDEEASSTIRKEESWTLCGSAALDSSQKQFNELLDEIRAQSPEAQVPEPLEAARCGEPVDVATLAEIEVLGYTGLSGSFHWHKSVSALTRDQQVALSQLRPINAWDFCLTDGPVYLVTLTNQGGTQREFTVEGGNMNCTGRTGGSLEYERFVPILKDIIADTA